MFHKRFLFGLFVSGFFIHPFVVSHAQELNHEEIVDTERFDQTDTYEMEFQVQVDDDSNKKWVQKSDGNESILLVDQDIDEELRFDETDEAKFFVDFDSMEARKFNWSPEKKPHTITQSFRIEGIPVPKTTVDIGNFATYQGVEVIPAPNQVYDSTIKPDQEWYGQTLKSLNIMAKVFDHVMKDAFADGYQQGGFINKGCQGFLIPNKGVLFQMQVNFPLEHLSESRAAAIQEESGNDLWKQMENQLSGERVTPGNESERKQNNIHAERTKELQELIMNTIVKYGSKFEGFNDGESLMVTVQSSSANPMYVLDWRGKVQSVPSQPELFFPDIQQDEKPKKLFSLGERALLNSYYSNQDTLNKIQEERNKIGAELKALKNQVNQIDDPINETQVKKKQELSQKINVLDQKYREKDETWQTIHERMEDSKKILRHDPDSVITKNMLEMDDLREEIYEMKQQELIADSQKAELEIKQMRMDYLLKEIEKERQNQTDKQSNIKAKINERLNNNALGEYETDLKKLQNKLDSDRQVLARWQEAQERLKKMYASGVASKKELDEMEIQVIEKEREIRDAQIDMEELHRKMDALKASQNTTSQFKQSKDTLEIKHQYEELLKEKVVHALKVLVGEGNFKVDVDVELEKASPVNNVFIDAEQAVVTQKQYDEENNVIEITGVVRANPKQQSNKNTIEEVIINSNHPWSETLKEMKGGEIQQINIEVTLNDDRFAKSYSTVILKSKGNSVQVEDNNVTAWTPEMLSRFEKLLQHHLGLPNFTDDGFPQVEINVSSTSFAEQGDITSPVLKKLMERRSAKPIIQPVMSNKTMIIQIPFERLKPIPSNMGMPPEDLKTMYEDHVSGGFRVTIY